MKIKNYVKFSVGAVLLSSFLFPCSSLTYAESGISSDKTIDSKEIIEQALEKDSLIPTNFSAPSVQRDSDLSEKEQKETTSSFQQQEEQTIGNLKSSTSTEEQTKEQKVQNNSDSIKNNTLENDSDTSSYNTVNHNQHYLYDFFEVTWKGSWWSGYYLVTGVKKTDNGVIDIPSQVYYNDNKSEVYQVRVSQKLWDDLKNKNQTFKDSVTKFNFPASGGHKAASFEDKQLNLSFIFGNDKGYIDNNYFGYRNLTSVDLSGLDWKFVNNTRSMFQSCSNLTTVTLGDGTNFLNISDMGNMFNGCSSLTSLDVSNWNTSLVTNMSGMFGDCFSLTSLDVSNWNTSRVTDMTFMFSGCSSLTSLDVSNWNTSLVTDMSLMFNGCSSLTSLDVSNWNTSRVTEMVGMFYNCSSLTSLDVSNWNTSLVTDMSEMFRDCSSLTSLDISNWNTSRVTDKSEMFRGCSSLTSLDVSN
ncbi:BspA family leucine-rich repeat surface protein [Enterococcus faecalis]|nr:BspA family leucine-rich repeat surface protein [Enterococcus faecalis]